MTAMAAATATATGVTSATATGVTSATAATTSVTSAATAVEAAAAMESATMKAGAARGGGMDAIAGMARRAAGMACAPGRGVVRGGVCCGMVCRSTCRDVTGHRAGGDACRDCASVARASRCAVGLGCGGGGPGLAGCGQFAG